MSIVIRDVREHELDSVLALNNNAGLAILPLDAARLRLFYETAEYFRVAERDGNLAGFLHVHERLGRLPLAAVIAPARDLARRGVELNERQSYFMGLLEPDEAVEKCRAILESTFDREQPLRRRVARKAAEILAAAGEVEKAIAAFEAGWCRVGPRCTTSAPA